MEQPKNSQNLQPEVDKIDTKANVRKEQPKKSDLPDSKAKRIRFLQDYLNDNLNVSSEIRKQCETQIIKLGGTLLSIDNNTTSRIEQQHVEGRLDRFSPPTTSSGASGSGKVSINTEDVEALLRQLRQFQDTIGGDWKTVVNQWQNLRDCWHDRQYDQFEPFFEELCQTYNQCESECGKHISFLMLAKLRAKLS